MKLTLYNIGIRNVFTELISTFYKVIFFFFIYLFVFSLDPFKFKASKIHVRRNPEQSSNNKS